jgi:hypothetical protein
VTQGAFWRGIFILWCLYVGYRGYREFGAGVLRISNFKVPPRLILRSERPAAYWAFIVFFYSIMLGLISLAAFAPASR